MKCVNTGLIKCGSKRRESAVIIMIKEDLLLNNCDIVYSIALTPFEKRAAVTFRRIGLVILSLTPSL